LSAVEQTSLAMVPAFSPFPNAGAFYNPTVSYENSPIVYPSGSQQDRTGRICHQRLGVRVHLCNPNHRVLASHKTATFEGDGPFRRRTSSLFGEYSRGFTSSSPSPLPKPQGGSGTAPWGGHGALGPGAAPFSQVVSTPHVSVASGRRVIHKWGQELEALADFGCRVNGHQADSLTWPQRCDVYTILLVKERLSTSITSPLKGVLMFTRTYHITNAQSPNSVWWVSVRLDSPGAIGWVVPLAISSTLRDRRVRDEWRRRSRDAACFALWEDLHQQRRLYLTARCPKQNGRELSVDAYFLE
jgi:hypothetical protein